jgi:hypothetical protein
LAIVVFTPDRIGRRRGGFIDRGNARRERTLAHWDDAIFANRAQDGMWHMAEIFGSANSLGKLPSWHTCLWAKRFACLWSKLEDCALDCQGDRSCLDFPR